MAPPAWPDDPLPELARRADIRPAVILDDDPTGTQTLRDVAVLTAWDADAVARHLHEPVVFLSTNSRSLDEAHARAITHDAAVTAWGAARVSGRPISIVTRSDSTLRGHFPTETAAVAEAMGEPEARVLLAPYFGDGGRLTIDDVHLLVTEGRRQPVGETEFARDAVFGYRSSDLAAWVAEKYAASGQAGPPIASLSLELIRGGGPTAVANALRAIPPRGVAIANAEVERDIEVIALGGLLAEEDGLPLVARSAASYVRARAGRAPAHLLTADELITDGPGLIIVGSHVSTTTRQLEHLVASTDAGRLALHELAIEPLLAGNATAAATITEVVEALEHALAAGRIGVVSTERARRDVGLEGARTVSSALVAVVERIERRPGWVIAKGGVTSSDVASRAMRMREARVAGQIMPGVPVWIGGAETRWPGVPFVVFPGNVGGPEALADAVRVMSTGT